MAQFRDQQITGDVEQIIEDINRRRRLKVLLAIVTIIGLAALGLVFAQVSATSSVPY